MDNLYLKNLEVYYQRDALELKSISSIKSKTKEDVEAKYVKYLKGGG